MCAYLFGIPENVKRVRYGVLHIFVYAVAVLSAVRHIYHRGSNNMNDLPPKCLIVKGVMNDIYNWLIKQPSVGEESITDWLLYQMSIKLPDLYYRKFNKLEEAKKYGADWEWWVITSSKAIGLRIQAKKVLPGKDNYKSIAHTNSIGLQIEMLTNKSREDNMLALYSFYCAYPGEPPVKCKKAYGANEGAFIAGAQTIYDKYITCGRNIIELDHLIMEANPLSCLFCCPLIYEAGGNDFEKLYSYFKEYHVDIHDKNSGVNSKDGNKDSIGVHEKAPDYVLSLLESFLNNKVSDWWEDEHKHVTDKVNSIVIQDLRKI